MYAYRVFVLLVFLAFINVGNCRTTLLVLTPYAVLLTNYTGRIALLGIFSLSLAFFVIFIFNSIYRMLQYRQNICGENVLRLLSHIFRNWVGLLFFCWSLVWNQKTIRLLFVYMIEIGWELSFVWYLWGMLERIFLMSTVYVAGQLFGLWGSFFPSSMKSQIINGCLVIEWHETQNSC